MEGGGMLEETKNKALELLSIAMETNDRIASLTSRRQALEDLKKLIEDEPLPWSPGSASAFIRECVRHEMQELSMKPGDSYRGVPVGHYYVYCCACEGLNTSSEPITDFKCHWCGVEGDDRFGRQSNEFEMEKNRLAEENEQLRADLKAARQLRRWGLEP